MTARQKRQALGRRVMRKQVRKSLRWMKDQPKKAGLSKK